jgi:hypothetical protein
MLYSTESALDDIALLFIRSFVVTELDDQVAAW